MSLSSLLEEENPELLKLRVLKQDAEISFLKRQLEGEVACRARSGPLRRCSG